MPMSKKSNIKINIKKSILFPDVGDRGEDRKGKEVTEDAEDKLIDPSIEGHFSNYMIPSIEELHQHQRTMCLHHIFDGYSIPCRRRLHLSLLVSGAEEREWGSK